MSNVNGAFQERIWWESLKYVLPSDKDGGPSNPEYVQTWVCVHHNAYSLPFLGVKWCPVWQVHVFKPTH